MVRVGQPNQQNPWPQAFPKQDIAGDRHDIQDPWVWAHNGSGGTVLAGSIIIFSESTTTDKTFTTSATVGDERVCGVLLEDTPNGVAGRVQIEGYVSRVRVASGTTRYQFLRQSSTAGVAEGIASPTHGIHGIALSSRDANGYVDAVIMHMHGASTVYDSISSTAVQHSFWDDFLGRVATVANSERYEAASNAAAPTFARDGTIGITYCRLGANVSAVGDYTYIRFVATSFTPEATADWGFRCIIDEGTAPVIGTGDLAYYVGFMADPTAAGTDGIYFRSDDSGNWTLVCRNAATESTASMGVGPDTTTKRLLEFRITGGGTSVQGYVGGVATGSAITTNIPTALLHVAATVICHTGNITTSGILRLWGWGVQSGF